jgi:hypothetical protein
MRWQTATVRAIAVSVAVFLLAACAIVVDAALRFDGKCGGFMPFLAAAQPCTLWQYLYSSVSFTLVVLFQEYWFVGLFLVGLAFLGSVVLERFWSRQDAV